MHRNQPAPSTTLRIMRAAVLPLLIVIAALGAFAYMQMNDALTRSMHARLASLAVQAADAMDPDAVYAIESATGAPAIPALLGRLRGASGDDASIAIYIARGDMLYEVTDQWPALPTCAFPTAWSDQALSGIMPTELHRLRDPATDAAIARVYAPIVYNNRVVALAVASAATLPLTRTLVAAAALLSLLLVALMAMLMVGLRGLTRYIADYDRYSQELAVSEERFKLATEGSDTAILDWNLAGGSYYASPRLSQMLGYAKEMPFPFDLVHEKDRAAHAAYLAELEAGDGTHYAEELRFLGTDHAYRTLHIAGRIQRSSTGGVQRVTCSVTDITQKRAYEERIYHLAYIDPLTGLANRTRFMEAFGDMLADPGDPPRAIALLCVDIDHFGRYNDSHGAYAGDELLRRTAECIERNMPSGALIARLQADAFYIALPGIATEKAVRTLCLSLKREYAGMPIQQGGAIDVTISVGATLYPEQGTDITTLMRNVETAMRVAKNMGRNGIRVFEKKMHSISFLGRRVEQDLPAALESGALEMWYQPLVSTTTRRIERVFALPRWWHPRMGLLMAGQFLPVARELGISATLEEWIVREVGEELRRWAALGGRSPRITLVFSAAWLSPQIAAVLWREKQAHDLPLNRLEVLIVGNEDSHLDRAVIDALRTMGVCVLLPNPERASRASLLTATSLDHANSLLVDGIATDMTLSQARGDEGALPMGRAERMNPMCLVCQPLPGSALREALSGGDPTTRKVDAHA